MECNLLFKRNICFESGYNKYKKIEEIYVELGGFYYCFEKRIVAENNKILFLVDESYPSELDSYTSFFSEFEEMSYDELKKKTKEYTKINTEVFENQRINIDLLKYDFISQDEFLGFWKREEYLLLNNKYYAKEVGKDHLYSLDYICSLDEELDNDGIIRAICWRDKILDEVMSGNPIEEYIELFEKIVEICLGRNVVVCHKESVLDGSSDYVISNKEFFKREGFWEKCLLSKSQNQPISFKIYSFLKEVCVEENKNYIGSFFSEAGYCIDLYKLRKSRVMNEDEYENLKESSKFDDEAFEELEKEEYTGFEVYSNISFSMVSGKLSDIVGKEKFDKRFKGNRFFIKNGDEKPFREINYQIAFVEM